MADGVYGVSSERIAEAIILAALFAVIGFCIKIYDLIISFFGKDKYHRKSAFARNSLERKILNGPLIGNKFQEKILVVDTPDECANAVNLLRSKIVNFRAIGFDCEWVSGRGWRKPVSLLQLASHSGFCVLFRLYKIQDIPKELKELLEDGSIYKVGVAPAEDDAQYLENDYNICVDGMIDLRILDSLISESPGGLAAMARKHLQIEMDKDRHVCASDWSAPELSERQIFYAAADAHVGVLLFKKIIDRIFEKDHSKSFLKYWKYQYWKRVKLLCEPNINLIYNKNLDYKC